MGDSVFSVFFLCILRKPAFISCYYRCKYPVISVGDPIYGFARGVRVPCLMLHAFSLSFEHPRSGRPVFFEAPLPEDFLRGLKGNEVPLPEELSRS